MINFILFFFIILH